MFLFCLLLLCISLIYLIFGANHFAQEYFSLSRRLHRLTNLLIKDNKGVKKSCFTRLTLKLFHGYTIHAILGGNELRDC